MDIYNHLIENIQKENKTINKKQILPDKKLFIPQDMKDIEKQKYYKQQRNKNSKTIVEYEMSHLIFQRDWNELNKAQKMNRIISYAKQNNLDKHCLLLALEKRNITEVKYDDKQGCIIELILKE